MTESSDTTVSTILIVDDTEDILQLLTTILNNVGHKTYHTESGKQALQQAADKAPDLILLDIKLPDMDGFEVCRHLKSNERTRSIPVIFISGLNEISDIVKGFEAGGVDYIIKPFKKAEVLARVETHLTLRYLRKDLEEKNHRLLKTNIELQNALKEIQTLKGIIPICTHCKKIRDDRGYWEKLESYIENHSEAEFSHSICPECAEKYYPEMDLYRTEDEAN